MGRTDGNRLTFFSGDIKELKGQLVKVKITEVRPFSLTGEPVEVRQAKACVKNVLKVLGEYTY